LEVVEKFAEKLVEIEGDVGENLPMRLVATEEMTPRARRRKYACAFVRSVHTISIIRTRPQDSDDEVKSY
jgi:hypothetical protein